ncbi:MAG TPA: hypothetical protein VGT61_11270 [Thermomicrobiales bacterium]|nr:hypothetical protein [Thermomicrobiales bacterium]
MFRLVSLTFTLLLLLGLLAPASAQDASPPATTDPGTFTLGQLAGDAFTLLPAAPEDDVSVISFGPVVMGEYTELGFVVANTTDEPIGQVEVAAEVLNADGDAVGEIDMSVIQPPVIAPGGYGIVLGTLPLEAAGEVDATIEPEVSWSEPADVPGIGSPEITALTNGDDGISGVAVNHTGAELQVVSIDAICFNEGGAITQALTGFTDGGAFSTLADGAETTFTLEFPLMNQGLPCDHVLVAGNGLIFSSSPAPEPAIH